jgi:3-oxoacyl-ACP reductase-like protein
MSVFGSIMSKIFHRGGAQAAPPVRPAAAAPSPQPAPQAQPQSQAQAPAAPTPASAVDVEAVLTVMANDNAQKLDWRNSIVDLMKLLSIDSSLQNRKALAQELGYTGDSNDSATMNIWLHKAVMRKLAENGGLVPDSLR